MAFLHSAVGGFQRRELGMHGADQLDCDAVTTSAAAATTTLLQKCAKNPEIFETVKQLVILIVSLIDLRATTDLGGNIL